MNQTPEAPGGTAGPDEPPAQNSEGGPTAPQNTTLPRPQDTPQDVPPGGPQSWHQATTPPGTPPGTPSGSGERGRHESDVFFDRIRDFGAVRLESGRWAAGVAGGLGRRFDIDPLLVRGIFVVLALISGIGLVLYGLGWAFLPQEDGRIHAQELLRGRFTAGLIGSAIVFFIGVGSTDGPGVFGGPHLWFWPVPGALMIVAAGIFLVWWFASGKHRPDGAWPRPDAVPGTGPGTGPGTEPGFGPGSGQPGQPWETGRPGHTGGAGWVGSDSPSAFTVGPPPLQPSTWQGSEYGSGARAATTALLPPPPVPPRPREPDHEAPLHALTLATMGLALIFAAGVGVWNRWVSDLPGNAFVIASAVALSVVAAGVVLAGLLGRRCGGLAPIGVLLAIAVVASGSVARVNDHIDRTTTWQVTSADVAAEGYKLDVGRLVVDLTSPSLLGEATREGPIPVTAEAGVGEIKIMVPDGVGVQVHSRVGLGSGPEGGQLLSHEGSRSGAGVDTTVRVGTGVTRFLVDAKVGLGAISIVDENGVEVR